MQVESQPYNFNQEGLGRFGREGYPIATLARFNHLEAYTLQPGSHGLGLFSQDAGEQ